MRRVGDRRARARLDVVGSLWGTLETRKRAQLVDLSETGALLLSPVHLAPNTVHTLEMTHVGRDFAMEVRVRHARPASPSGAYHLGVEFLSHPLMAP